MVIYLWMTHVYIFPLPWVYAFLSCLKFFLKYVDPYFSYKNRIHDKELKKSQNMKPQEATKYSNCCVISSFTFF